MAEPEVPVCWICKAPLRVKITHNRNGKAALTLWCGEDGRHLRAFCNHKPVVEEIVARLEAQATDVPTPAVGEAPSPTHEAHQKTSGEAAAANATGKRRAG